jgi:hypothetical protein
VSRRATWAASAGMWPWVGLAALLCAGCATVDMTKYPDPHGHKIAVHLEKSSPYHVEDLTRSDDILPMFTPSAENAMTNAAHTLAASLDMTHHQFYGYKVPVLVLLRDGRPFATFVSHTWPNRPMVRLAWLDNQYVCFDLPAGDVIGWHYLVDAEAGCAVFAAPYADQ